MSFGRLVNEADVRLRKWLDSAGFAPGTRIPSERSLAASLGIPYYSLNRAMARLITEGRIERDGYKLFIASPHEENVVLTCHLLLNHASTQLPSYKRVAKDMGVKLVLHPWKSIEEALFILNSLRSDGTEAVLLEPPYLCSSSIWMPVATELIEQGIPLVSVGQPGTKIFSVLSTSYHDVQLAIDHLTELGHRELAFVTPPISSPASAETFHAWGSLCRLNRLYSSESRVFFQHQVRLKEEANEIATLFDGTWKNVTGLILHSTFECNIELLQDNLAQHARRPVPGELSLVFVGAGRLLGVAPPSVTSVSVDTSLMHETALLLAMRAAQKRKRIGILPAACCLRVQSQLIVRNSTASPPNISGSHPNKNQAFEADKSQTQPEHTPVNADSDLSRLGCTSNPYPLAVRASLAEHPRFAPLDISTLVNRSLNYRRGWLGDLPLKHLPPGMREIHGVPFNILGGPGRLDCGALVFRSSVNNSGNYKNLPERVVIPLTTKAAAVYVLHGCGYANHLQLFAHYRFLQGLSCVGHVPLVSLGRPLHDRTPSETESSRLLPNIQDWWPDFPQQDFPHSKMAPIIGREENNYLSHAYLYTMEWVNPNPDEFPESLEITVDPTARTTLGVLAITVLKP